MDNAGNHHNLEIMDRTQKIHFVFVYMGNQVPNYMAQNILRTSRLFLQPVHLIVDDETVFGGRDRFPNIQLYTISSKNLQKVDDFLAHDFSFRGGFWFHSFNRLLLLQEFHQRYFPDESIIHLEGDMLLFPSFPFAQVSGDKLSWFNNGDDEDVASIIFSPNAKETSWLCKQLVEVAQTDSRVTDMSALNRIRKKNMERIDNFRDIAALQDITEFEGIFDGAPLGQWLCGMDPRNTFGMKFLHENNSSWSGRFGDLMKNIEFKLDVKSNLKVKYQDKHFFVHSLHVHSKDEVLFKLDNRRALSLYVEKSLNYYPEVVSIDAKLFAQLILGNFRNRTLYSYLRNLIKFLRKRDMDNFSRYKAVLKYLLLLRK